MKIEQHPSLFEELSDEIASEYGRLGHTLGWRFLNVSRKVLDSPARIALVTINPAGDHIPPDHPTESCENGASYLVESWGGNAPGQATLQVQVQRLFQALATEMRFSGSSSQLLEQSLISQFVPFRSPEFKLLPRKTESVQFGRKLWMRILPVASPRLIVCLGRDVQKELLQLIPTALEANHLHTERYPTGWGTYSAEVSSFDRAGAVIRLLYLPHLSRWTLFTSAKCAAFIPAIIRGAAKDA